MNRFRHQSVFQSAKRYGMVGLCFVLAITTVMGLPRSLQSTAHAAGESKPFPQQVSYSGVIKPNHISQSTMNADVTAYYNSWKSKYLKSNLSSLPGGYYVKGDITGSAEGYTPLGTSEGQGYGMVITALMAGYDANAKTIYDGLFKTARAYKSSGNSNLMGWVVADAASAQGHFGSATDGDMDIAYSLILAHNQWGSAGTINYLNEAKKMITQGIKASYVTSNNRLNLGDWDSKSALNTRPSDWMLSHMRAFYDVTGDQTWLNVINNLYSIYSQFSTSYSSTTGLISDFVINDPPAPAPTWFLDEFLETNEYNYNAARVPLRIVMDYAMYGDTRGKTISDKIATWIKTKTSGQPGNVKDGYKLNGTVTGSASGAEGVFVAPFIAASVTNSSHQAWVNAGWDWMKNKKTGYYSDSITMLSMLFISGNWWKPTAAGGGTTDTQAPTAPTNLTAATVSSTQINLNWTASSDNVGVAGYKVLRNGTQIATVLGTSYSNAGLSPATTYNYTVTAYDAVGNTSGNSNSVSATTASGGTQTGATITASGDSFVRGGTYQNDNYGTLATMVVKKRDNNINFVRQAYLKFNTSTITGTINTAVLRLYVNNLHSNTTSYSIQAKGINNDSWNELTLTAANQPSEAGISLGTAAVQAEGGYVYLDVKSFVASQSDGVVSFRIVGLDEDLGADYAAKDHATGAYRPVLIINGG